MKKQTYVQQCAHNLHERRQVASLLAEEGISVPRKRYLKKQLNALNRERSFFMKIKDEFILFPNDCFKL